MRKRRVWSHKKHGKAEFTGTYGKDETGERVFILIKRITARSKSSRNITFESPQAAKALGWELV